MPLSALQKYIIKSCYRNGKVGVKGAFEKFYLSSGALAKGGQTGKKAPARLEQIKIISRSIDRLINKGYLVGYGEKTQFKWFINEIKLTHAGRRMSKKLQGEQIKLPFKK